MTRRLLFLAYYFAPHQAVAAVRTTAMARHLADLGWQVTVVTVDDALLVNHDATLCTTPSDPSRLTIIRTPHDLRFLFPSALKCRNAGLSRVVGGTCRFLCRKLAVERESGWRSPAWRALTRFAPGSFDVVLSSGGPWMAHVLAAAFARHAGIPYVLDYRDLWCGNPKISKRPSSAALQVEQQIRAGSAAVTAISPSILAVQDTLMGPHPCALVVTNGYDQPPPVAPTPGGRGEFTLLYAGQFYPPFSTLTPFLQAFTELRRRHPIMPLALHYVGPSATHVRQVLATAGHPPGVRLEERVPRATALQLLHEAGVALVSASNEQIASPAGAGIITGKIFEIFAHRKPYLVVAPENSDLHEVVRTAGGGRVFTSSKITGMVDYLEQVMLGHQPAYSRPEEFAWETIARRLSGILDEVVAKPQL